jgi:diguanylate cyclase (GGDEF)-like protein
LDGEHDEMQGLALGAVDYISKPLVHEIVRLRVRTQLKLLEQYRELERMSMQDQLTKLPNRRWFEIRLNAEWGRTIRENLPLSLLIIDIDNFKVYNDTHGHPQGDNALKAVAEVFDDTLKRSCDFAARWGGEEFIAVLPNTGLDGALELAERIRKNTEKMQIPLLSPIINESAQNITVSIGVKTRTPDETITAEELISIADEMLYKAKNNGRNQVAH